MPNKTIYVSEDDLPLFERAQQIVGGNLSSAIAHALRRLIEVEEAKQDGWNEITVLVGGVGGQQRKRFLGSHLVRRLQSTNGGKGTILESTYIFNVYRTAKGRFALHTRTLPDWDLAWGDPEYVGDPKNWGVGNGLLKRLMSWGYDWETFKVSGDYTLHVFETLDELKVHIPEHLYKAVVLAMELPPQEDLDI